MDNSQIEELKRDLSALQIYNGITPLQRAGREYKAHCPFPGHRDSTPSFTVREVDGVWLWQCFGCPGQPSGNVVQLVQKLDNISFNEAAKKVQTMVGGSFSAQRAKVEKVFKPLAEDTKTYRAISLDQFARLERRLAENQSAQNWLLEQRGISYETARSLHLGFQPDVGKIAGEDAADIADKGWIALPCIRDGKVVSIEYRSIARKCFRRHPGMATELFNLPDIDPLEPVYVTEGKFDAAVLKQAGYQAVSLPSGTGKISPDARAKLLEAECVILAGDTDATGSSAMDKLWRELKERTFLLRWPDGKKDANQVFLQTAQRDIGKFQELVDRLTHAAKANPIPGIYNLQETMMSMERTNLVDHPERMRFPWPKVDDMMILLPGSVLVVGATNTGMGKELEVHTPVMTPEGLKEIGQLALGDRVIGSNGLPTQVVGVFPQGKKPGYRVTFTDGTSLVCGAEHLWAVRSNCMPSYRVLTTKQILAGRPLKTKNNGFRHHVPLVKPVIFHEVPESLIQPYTLGALLGDGGLSSAAVVTFTNADSEIVDRLRRECPVGLELKRRARPAIQYCYRGRPNLLRKALRELNLLGAKSADKFIPDIYKFGSVSTRISLLQGLMDTDGWTGKNKSAVFYSISCRLAEDTAFVVRSLGGTAAVRVQTRLDGRAPLYYVGIRLPEGINPFWVSRKANAYDRKAARCQPTKAIKSIEPAGEFEMFCITVNAPDGLYVVQDFTVTHNTQFVMNSTIHAAREHDEVVLNYQCELTQEEFANIVTAHLLRKDRNRLTPSDGREAAAVIKGVRYYIGRDENLSRVGEVLDLIEAAIRVLGATTVVLDHIHFICRNEKDEIQAQANAMQRIKLMAQQYRCKFIVVTQPRKAKQGTEGKAIHITGLKGSETVGSDADGVINLHRDYVKVKDPLRPPRDEYEQKTEVHNLKARAKGTGAAYTELMFLGESATFVPVAYDAPSEPGELFGGEE